MNPAQHALRKVRILYAAFLSSIVMYALAGSLLGPMQQQGAETVELLRIFVPATLLLLGVAVMFRVRVARPQEKTLAVRPDDPHALSRWSSSGIIAGTLCEAAALLGLIHQLLGGSWYETGVFYGSGFLVLLALWPRPNFTAAP